MSQRHSLRTRILYWLVAYAVLLATGIALHGFLVNEYAERLLWDSLVQTEFERHIERKNANPDYHWIDSDGLRLYVTDGSSPPPATFDGLPDGIHDELLMDDGSEVLALVRHVDGVRHVLVLDITEMEQEEDRLTLFILGSAAILVTLMGMLMAFGLGRALRPLADMASAIATLSPDRSHQRITISQHSSSELVIIANALNDYLQRNESFVERERAFINTASHELRTPVAVIGGASEIGLHNPQNPATMQHQLQRIQRTARDMEQLISLLLTLAKEPSRLAQASESIALDLLLPEIIDDHLHLTEGKTLILHLAPPPPCTIMAPPGIVRAAVGNLLRNAIEHSDNGNIDIQLSANAVVSIRDPGHGMDPEKISAIYSQLARGGFPHAGNGNGIGLDLISRLCAHLGWILDISSDPASGTTATLCLRNLGVQTRD